MTADRQKIGLAMANACMTPSELSERAELPRSTVNNVIGGRSVRPATLGRIAKALGVPVTELLEDKQ